MVLRNIELQIMRLSLLGQVGNLQIFKTAATVSLKRGKSEKIGLGHIGMKMGVNTVGLGKQ